jgi:hypothetical protein
MVIVDVVESSVDSFSARWRNGLGNKQSNGKAVLAFLPSLVRKIIKREGLPA